MIRLDLSNEPKWLDLAEGLRICVLPVTTAVMVAARHDAAVEDLPDDSSAEQMALVMAKAVARRIVTDWEGVGDANDNPVAVSPEGIDALLDIWPIFEAFQRSCLAPHLMLAAEKNGSSPLPSGISEGATTIAQPAQQVPTAKRHQEQKTTSAKTARRG